MTPRCDGRYPVPHKREEPFEVTYRCGMFQGHQGPCGPWTVPAPAPPSVGETGWEDIDGENADYVNRITAVVREADRTFEKVGGSSRHWVRDCFLPLLNRAGLRIQPTSDISAGGVAPLMVHADLEHPFRDTGGETPADSTTHAPEGETPPDAWEARDGVLQIGTRDEDGFHPAHEGDVFDLLTHLRAERDAAVQERDTAEARFHHWSGTDVPALNIALGQVRQQLATARRDAFAEVRAELQQAADSGLSIHYVLGVLDARIEAQP